MGPNWIVVVSYDDNTCKVEEFAAEDEARKRFDAVREMWIPGRAKIYLATVKAEVR